METESQKQLKKQELQKNYQPFKQKYTVDQRRMEVEKQLQAHPNMAAIVVEWHPKSKNLAPLPKKKFLVERTHKLAEFQATIRNKLGAQKEDSIIFFIDKHQLTTPDKTIGEVYDEFKDEEDGFLYLIYCDIDPFGND